jgi:hypothetical protein
MIRTRKRGKSLTTRRTEAEEELNIIGLKTSRQLSETTGNGGRLSWKPRSERTIMPEEEEEKKNQINRLGLP